MFNGDCEAAFRLYERVTGGKIVAMMPYPMARPPPPTRRPSFWQEDHSCSPGDRWGLAHGLGRYAPITTASRRAHRSTLRVDTPEQAEKGPSPQGLSDGASIKMAMAETFFAQKFGTLVDKFGTHWMVICEKPM